MSVSGVFPQRESCPDNRRQLWHRGRDERPVRQTRGPARSKWPGRGKPQKSSQTVHRLWSHWGTLHTDHVTDMLTPCRRFCEWSVMRTKTWINTEIMFWDLSRNDLDILLGFGVKDLGCVNSFQRRTYTGCKSNRNTLFQYFLFEWAAWMESGH